MHPINLALLLIPPKNHHALMDIFKLFIPQSVDVQDEINPGSLR